MIKKLLSSLAIIAVSTSFGQTNKTASDIGVRDSYVMPTINAKSSALQCDTLYNFNVGAATTTLTIYTLNTSTACLTGGYVVGNNCYGDAEKATYFAGSSYSALTSPSVTGCFVFFYKNATTGRGTKGGATNTMGMNIYNGTMAGGPTGAAIGNTSATMGAITSVFTSTSSLGAFMFTFTSPVAVSPAGFFASAVLPTVAGDTAVIYQQYTAATTSGWEMDNASTWYDMKTNWGGTLNFEMCMFPILGCSPLAISENELANFFKIVPNPSNGVFSLVSTLSTISYDINVTNTLGQVIMSKKGINGAAVNEINLSEYNSGVYFMNITSGKNTITKKLVLNK